MLRILSTILLFLLIFFFPWWIVFMLGIVAAFVFRSYYELLVIGIVIDSLYNAPVAGLFKVELVVSFLSLFILIIAEHLKPRLTFYSER